MPAGLFMAGLRRAIAALTGGAAYLSPGARVRRTMRRAARFSIAEAPEGKQVRIAGTIFPGDTIRAPVSARACVHFEVGDTGTGGRPWGRRGGPRVYRQSGSAAFVIDDGTGRAIIDPTGAEIVLHAWQRNAAFSPEGGKREVILAIGDPVEVCGLAVREPDPEAASREVGYRDMPTRLRLEGSRRVPLLVREAPELVALVGAPPCRSRSTTAPAARSSIRAAR